jgi:DNA-binding transcriptional MerR regulator
MMPLSRSRDYLSIGEVLDAVREEFPDVSISKIRFLEAEGLLTPTRTSSGYRKFYESDVATLRYILTLQRDHFLPLKVIKERLAAGEPNSGGPVPPPLTLVRSDDGDAGAEGDTGSSDLTGASMDRAELCRAARLTELELQSLEEFGVLQPSDGGRYDENDLLVARACKGFLDHGLEPRHLKMYRQFAEREAAFFEQIVTPVTRQRTPDAHSVAAKAVRELAALSRQMREGVLRTSLRQHL